MSRLVVVHPDASVLAHAVAARLLTTVLDIQSVRQEIHLSLTGGRIGIASLQSIAASPLCEAIDWSGVHLWWSDERFVPRGDEERNETQARRALLDGLAHLDERHIHAVPGSDEVATAADAAARYAAELAAYAGSGRTSPEFDVSLLSIGPDGHIASLFPGHAALDVTGSTTVAVTDSPKPPPQRISFTYDAIRCAREVWLLAAGTEKVAALGRALTATDVHQAPAAGAFGKERTLWLVDAQAAGPALPVAT